MGQESRKIMPDSDDGRRSSIFFYFILFFLSKILFIFIKIDLMPFSELGILMFYSDTCILNYAIQDCVIIYGYKVHYSL